MAAINLSGQKFGRLTAIRRSGTTLHRQARWLCRCDCDGVLNLLEVGSSSLRSGHTQSCGCLQREVAATNAAANGRASAAAKVVHGHAAASGCSRTYRSWSMSRNRCTNPNCNRWENYGGRGIRMCDRWLNSFAAFLADMGERPPGTSLDRYPDPDGNYEPGNCRWATRSEQSQNKRHPKRSAKTGRWL